MDITPDPLGLANRIKQARQEKGLTQTALSKQLGCSKAVVSQWESGHVKDIRLERFFELADALDVIPRWLAIGIGRKRDLDIAKDRPSDGILDMKSRIHAAMAWRGVSSQSELARRLSLTSGRQYSRQTVNNWLLGKVENMSHDALFDLAATLEVSARWLAQGKPNPPDRPIWLSADQGKLLALAEGLRVADSAYLQRWIENGQWELDRKANASGQPPAQTAKAKKIY